MENLRTLFKQLWRKGTVESSSGLKAVLMRGSIGNFILKIFSTLIGFASSIILARNLELNEFGLFAYIIALVSFLSLPATAGVPSLIVRETSKSVADEDWARVRGLWRWGWLVIGLFSLFTVALTAAVTEVIAHYFYLSDLEVFFWALLLIPLFALSGMRGGALSGLRHVVLGGLPDLLIRPVLFTTFLLILVYVTTEYKLTPLIAIKLQLLALVISFVVGTLILRRVTPEQLKSKPDPVYDASKWFKSLIPLALISGMVPLLQYTDILMLGVFESADQVALYRVALSASLLVAFGLQSISAAMAPHLVHIHHKGDSEQLQRVVTKSTKAIVAFSAFVLVLLLLAGKALLEYFYGEAYGASYQVLSILIVGQFVKSLTGVSVLLLNMTGNEPVAVSVLARSVLTNILLNLVLIPLYGMTGAALATVATIVIRGFMLRMIIKRKLGIEVFLPFNFK